MIVDVPVLPTFKQEESEEEEEEEQEEEVVNRKPPAGSEKARKHTSGPKIQDPYAMSDSTSYVIPIVGAVAAFIPLLYCLCKI